MAVLRLILLLIAAILFALAAFTQPGTRFNLVAAGLLSWVCAVLVGAIQTVD